MLWRTGRGVVRPELTGVLSADDVAATAASIRRHQTDDGLVLWFDDGHADPWNHVEAAMALDTCGLGEEALAAYDWLRRHQHPEGWWHHYYLRDGVEDPKIDTNVCAYVAAGVWHHHLLHDDRSFLATYRPVVERALDDVLRMQRPTGEIVWARHADGTPWTFALLTGSSSILHSLRCGIAIVEALGDERPDWELAAARLADAIAQHPERFSPKDRWAMDWYYPVLSGPLTGDAGRRRLDDGYDTFVMDGRGVRCVSDRPWITAAETCECAIAHARVGRHDRAVNLVTQIAHLRHDDGSVHTGIVYPDEVTFPHRERSTYSAAALVLAVDALSRATPASGLFVDDDQLPELIDLSGDVHDAAVEPRIGD